MDRITIRNQKLEARVGWSDDERSNPQLIYVTVVIEADLHAAGRSDDLADTIDYSRATTEIAELVREGSFRLLEFLAERIAGHISRFKGVRRVTVEIAKESPPIAEDVGAITVRISRP